MRSVLVLATAVGLLGGCSSSDPVIVSDTDGDGMLKPPAASEGLQLKMVSTIEPGREIERCKFFQVPETGLNINHSTVRYVPGSHHVLLYRTEYTSIPTETRAGAPAPVADENGVFDCANGATADWAVSGIIGGAQSSNANDMSTFPPGVAVKLAPGTILVINTHYLNTTAAPLRAEARINLYTLADKDVMTEGGTLFFYNPFIRLHPQSAGSARMSCPITQDITLGNAQSHMHKRGMGYTASLVEAGNSTQIYESHDWENVPVTAWKPGMDLHPGQSIDYTCNYQNSEDREIIQGLTTKDEMCMFIGSYYPRNVELEQCQPFTVGKGATFIGSGTTDGPKTLQCFRDAGANTDMTARRSAFFGCVVDSCPSIADQLSAYLKCQQSSGPTCGAVCDGTNPTACTDCMLTQCGAVLTALNSATCN